MAEALGRTEDHAQFARRAQSFRSIFDPATGFMRAKKSDGSFREPFDPVYAQYGSDYTEGNAWQYSWFVPHDVRGLIGLYAHGNEPSQHIAYLHSYAGQPWRTQERVRQIMTRLFDDTPEGISGNEDCGRMSAWYVWSALGFYPVTPRSLEYVIGAPQLKKAVLDVGGGKTFTVEATGLSDLHLYVQSATLDGKAYGKAFVRHEDIVKGGTLRFVMGPRPKRSWASAPTSAPYSMSDRRQ